MAVHTEHHGAASGEKRASTSKKRGSTVQPSVRPTSYEAYGPPVYLSKATIEIPSATILRLSQLPRVTVPPPSPSSEFQFELKFQSIPRTNRDLAELEIPIIRDKGVKHCIEEMSEFFQCADYKFNFLQFWFLDLITDCIWRAQDLFEFPQEQQRTILAWLLFVIDLISDQKKNYSQQEFFDAFKETIITAASVLEEGSGDVLYPLKLVQFSEEEEEEEIDGFTTKKSSDSSHLQISSKTSTKSTTTKVSSSEEKDSMDYESIIEFEVGEEQRRLVLDHELCDCSEFGESLPSTVERLLDEQTRCDSKQSYQSFEDEGEEEVDNWDYRDFYKADSKIPSRFLPLTESEELQRLLHKKVSLKDIGPTSELTFLPIGRSEATSNRSSDKLTDYVIFRKVPWQNYDTLCGESVIENESDIGKEKKNITKDISKPGAESKPESEETQEKKIMEGLKKFKVMEQRVRDFSDSKVGLGEWQMKSEKSNVPNTTVESEEKEKATCFIDEEIEDMVDKETLKNLDEEEFLSFGVLWAIIDFVYEYFSDSFQYTLIKMALTIQHNVIVQRLNDEWHTPKGLIEDLTLFVKDLKDKHKIIQRKIEKEQEKKGKKDKKKDKEKKTDKSSKKTKEKKSKASDKSKKGKEKKVHVTEEELLLQRQLEEQEEERIRQELNKRFMFPLQDAIGDEFFMSKFANWQKVDLLGKGKGKGKDKGKDKKKKK